METAAAIKIQAVVRGYLVRRCQCCGGIRNPRRRRAIYIPNHWYIHNCHECAGQEWYARYEEKYRYSSELWEGCYEVKYS